MQNSRTKDYLDVHVTSQDGNIDAFSQYPLLDGSRKYTVELTEFCCPINVTRLPPISFFEDDAGNTLQYFFEIRRKQDGTPVFHNDTSMGTLRDSADLAGGDLLFPENDKSGYMFRKSALRPIETVSDLYYHLQRFFADFIGRYRERDSQHIISGNAHGYGGGDDQEVDEDTQICSVILNPSGTLSLTFSDIFTKFFFITVTKYGQKILGLPETIAFRTDDHGNLLDGLDALLAPNGTIQIGGADTAVKILSSHSVFRFFDHRVRLEVETQMGIPVTSVWSTTNSQQLSHVMATFPIQAKYSTTVVCDPSGVVFPDIVRVTDELQHGPIVFRSAEDKVSERYQVLNPQYFHNIRLEVFIVRREYKFDLAGTMTSLFTREKLVFDDDDYWTAKLRFKSI